MNGLHLTADLRDCACHSTWFTDAEKLVKACEDMVLRCGLTPVARLAHTFPATAAGPGGVTATVLLAESHLCVHTWPESRSVSLDVYVCNFSDDNSDRATILLNALLLHFKPDRMEQNALVRGQSPVDA